MKILIIGGDSFIGQGLREALKDSHEVVHTSRRGTGIPYDYLTPTPLPIADCVFILAASTRFIDCEDDPNAYRINVDGPMGVLQQWNYPKVVYVSSEAVERALGRNTGL